MNTVSIFSSNKVPTNELATDNDVDYDVDDESTGGIDEDDYDAAQVMVNCQFNICLPITITRN